jgi:hypothetical protein
VPTLGYGPWPSHPKRRPSFASLAFIPGPAAVKVYGDKVSVSFGTRAPFEIPLSDIGGCSVTPLPLAVTAMWGRQRQADLAGLWSPFRRQGVLGVPRAFWIGGGNWVVIELVGGKQICVGSDEPHALAAAINAALAPRHDDAGTEVGPLPVQPMSVL